MDRKKDPGMIVREEAKEKENGKPENLFSKEQLLSAERFQSRKDLLNALLLPEKLYSISDVEREIAKYMKGQVG